MKRIFNWTIDKAIAIYNKWERLTSDDKAIYILRGFWLITSILAIISLYLLNWTIDKAIAIYNKWERLSDNEKMIHIIRGYCLIKLILAIISFIYYIVYLSLID